MLTDTGQTVEDPVAYNARNYKVASRPSGECIGAKACTSCGDVIADSICLCSGRFTCPRCNTENGFKYPDDFKLEQGYIFEDQ